MDFLKSLSIAASGLRAQTGRMRVIAENIANADSTARSSDGDPYRRRIPTFDSEFSRELNANLVAMGKVAEDKSAFKLKYQPGHPAADKNGYIRMPNVNPLIETVDLQEAQRSYQANLNVIRATRKMLQKTIDILRV